MVGITRSKVIYLNIYILHLYYDGDDDDDGNNSNNVSQCITMYHDIS